MRRATSAGIGTLAAWGVILLVHCVSISPGFAASSSSQGPASGFDLTSQHLAASYSQARQEQIATASKRPSQPQRGIEWMLLIKRVTPLAAGVRKTSSTVWGRLASVERLVTLPARHIVYMIRAPGWDLARINSRTRGWFSSRPLPGGPRVSPPHPGTGAQPARAETRLQGLRTSQVAMGERGEVFPPGDGMELAWASIQQRTKATSRARGWFSLRPVSQGAKTDPPGAVQPRPKSKAARALSLSATGRAQTELVRDEKQQRATKLVQAQPAVAPAAGQKQPGIQPAGSQAQPQGQGAGGTQQQPAPGPTVPPAGAGVGMPLGPGDVIAITVLDEPKLTGQFMVREDGKLNLPILGMVQASGLTPTQLEDQLTKLCQKYIIKPVVSVMPVSAAPKVVSILGQVARPGTYDLRQCPTVLAVLAAAGGALPMANMSEAVLVRGKDRIKLVPEGTKEAVPEDMPLKPGDAIYVPPRVSAPVYVMGSVVKPGAQALEAATTASKAVILSGGPAPNADLRHAYILRGRDKVNVNLAPFLGSGREGEQAKDVPLQPGDVVVLPQKVQRHVYVVGAVNTPGAEPIEEAERVSQAIAMAGGLSDAADKANAYLIRGGEKTKLDLAGLFDQGKVEADMQLEAGDAIVVPKRLPIFHIVGEVEKPGPYQLDQARSVLDAWSLVGKPLDDADLSHVVLLREGEKPRTIDIDALVNKGDMAQNVELQPGDKLVVPKAVEYVYVLGQVAKPGPKAYKPGETLIELIGRAGGPTPLADVKSIVLVHREQLAEMVQEATGATQQKQRPGRRAGRQRGQEKSKIQVPSTQPKEGQKVTIMDLARVQGEEVQYIAKAGDVIYIPAVRQGGRNWLPSVLSAIVTGLIVRR